MHSRISQTIAATIASVLLAVLPPRNLSYPLTNAKLASKLKPWKYQAKLLQASESSMMSGHFINSLAMAAGCCAVEHRKLAHLRFFELLSAWKKTTVTARETSL